MNGKTCLKSGAAMASTLAWVGAVLADTLHVPEDYPTIQAAIAAAAPGDEIVVAPGTYHEAINLLGKIVRVRSAGGPGATTIDASGIGGSVVTCISGESPDTILDGFTITGGTGNQDLFPYVTGGGLIVNNSAVTVADCIFAGNQAELGGGCLVFQAGLVSFTDCHFVENVASLGGAGVFVQDDFAAEPTTHVVLTRCRFTGNTSLANWGGAGLRVSWSSADVIDCEFIGNTSLGQIGGGALFTDYAQVRVMGTPFVSNHAKFGGGAFASVTDLQLEVDACVFAGNTSDSVGGALLFILGGQGSLTNCLFTGNQAAGAGGAVWCGTIDEGVHAHADLVNCTFVGNKASGGGAVRINPGGGASIVNSILRQNAPGEISTFELDALAVSHSNIHGGWPGPGNIDADPLFLDLASGDYRLAAGSPCIDTGDDAAVPPGVTTDLAGNHRFVSAAVDMGAYEFQGCYADLDQSGALNLFDFLLFVNLFNAGDPAADCDGNQAHNLFDFLCFTNAYNAGC